MFKKSTLSSLLAVLVTMSLFVTAGTMAAETVKKQKIPLYPKIEFQTTEGNFTLELDGRRAPITVQNFAKYVQNGQYDGTVFHRVIPGFMAQAGGYDADLAEKPVKNSIANESGNGLRNLRGTVAMARLNPPHTATAQFFINLVDNKALDPNKKRWGYAVFGEVIDGMDVIDKIAKIPTGAKGSFGSDVPEKDVVITKASILPE